MKLFNRSRGDSEKSSNKLAKSKRARVREELKSLIGKLALTKTKMGFTGLIEVDGEKREAISHNIFVREGEWVRVIGERFGLLVVEPCETQQM